MICFLLVLPIVIGFIVCEVLLVAFPDTLFFESETVNTYNLISRDKQLTVAERTYNLDEDISATVTETVYRYALIGSLSKNNDDIYISKIQYVSSDGTKKESTSVIKEKEDIRNRKLTPIITINTLLMIAFIVLEIIFLRVYHIANSPDYWIKSIQSLYMR